MTTQKPETLRNEGKALSLCSQPLSELFAERGNKPPFRATSTALWRGYVGHWSIIGDKLYLDDIKGELSDGSKVSLQTVFPDASGPVLADWYTGTLRIPQGDRLRYVHGGYASVYAQDLLIDIEKGIVTRTQVRENTLDNDDDDDDDD